MSLTVTSARIDFSPDGSIDSDYPGGDKPPTVEALSWDLSTYLNAAGIDNIIVGTPFSHDVRQHLLGTERLTASISLVLVSGSITGFNTPGAGDDLTHDAVSAGSGSFKVRATGTTGSVDSTVKTWASTNPASVPGQVTGVQATVNSSSQITVSWTATPGATSYKAKRGGSVIQSGVTETSYAHTGLTASTQYSFTVVATNVSGDGTESSAVLATTNASGGAFAPPFPRLFLRQAFSNMNVLNVTGSLANFQTAAGHIAKFNAGMFTGTRGSTFGNGQYSIGGTNSTNSLIDYVKSRAEYAGESAYCKYTNVTQINSDSSTDNESVFLQTKVQSEVNGSGDWVIRNTSGTPVSNKPAKWNINFFSWVTADSENGLKWSKWYPRFWCCPFNFSGSPDYKIGTGHGIGEGAWDGVFCDDQAMITGQGGEVSGADLDEDGISDSASDSDVQTARSQGYVDTQAEWRSLFTNTPAGMHTKGTLKYFIGNITAIALKTDIWPTNMRSIYNGGLIEEVSGKSKAQGFGSYTINDDANHAHSGMMGVYWRGMENCISPRIVAWGHEAEPEFRQKWGAVGAKPNNWITEGGGNKYPGVAGDFSDWRLLRWALACCLMDDGYFSSNQTTSTWTTGIPWYDEYVGGTEVNLPGWMGQRIGTPPRAAYEHGVWKAEFDNALVIMNPPRSTPNTDQGWTVTVPSAGTGKRWKRLNAKTGGYTTDGTSGTQDATHNNNAFVTASGASGPLTIREFDAVFMRRVNA